MRKKDFLKEKFSRVTRGYDLVNRIGSFGRDGFWRRKAARELSGLPGPILDLCAGTLALSVEIVKEEPRKVVALDITPEMLLYGIYKLEGRPELSMIVPVCADAEELPFPSETFYGATIAFGLRNLSDRKRGLLEVFRVLKPGGKFVVLEFSRPYNRLFEPIYRTYLKYFLTTFGWCVTGDREAYSYLARSIYEFPPPEAVKAQMEEAGFREVNFYPLTMGVVTIYTGLKKP